MLYCIPVLAIFLWRVPIQECNKKKQEMRHYNPYSILYEQETGRNLCKYAHETVLFYFFTEECV